MDAAHLGLPGAQVAKGITLSGVLRWAATGLVITAVLFAAAFLRDINRAYDRIGAKGSVIPSAFGDIEFTEGGEGVDVLVIHGSGGGDDQGELIAQALLGEEFHWITPSRCLRVAWTGTDRALLECVA